MAKKSKHIKILKTAILSVIVSLSSLLCSRTQKSVDSNILAVETSINIHEAYRNHCWKCSADIDSSRCKRCPECGWYICTKCGACESGCVRNQSSSSKKSGCNDFSEYTVVIVLVIVVGCGIYLHKRGVL